MKCSVYDDDDDGDDGDGDGGDLGELAVGNSYAFVGVRVCVYNVFVCAVARHGRAQSSSSSTKRSIGQSTPQSPIHLFLPCICSKIVGEIEVWHSHLDCTCW